MFFGCEKFLVIIKIEIITIKFQILLYLFFDLYLGTKNMQKSFLGKIPIGRKKFRRNFPPREELLKVS